MTELQAGDLIYHLESGYAAEYKVFRLNTRTIRVHSTDGTKEFSITYDEYIDEWNSNLHQLYMDEIAKIDNHIERLLAPIHDDIRRLKKTRRNLLMRLGNSSRLSRPHRPKD